MFTKSKLLGIADVCDILWVSKQYIHRICKEWKLRYENTSSWKIFLESDIIAFQKARIKKWKVDMRIKGSNIDFDDLPLK